MDWVDHAYMYSVVYLEQQFYQPMMSLNIFKDINNEHLQHLAIYGTSPTIPHWDGWHELSEEDHYHLLFKHTEESATNLVPEATGLYYYIGMDLNVGQLWKQTPAHNMMPTIGAAINIALLDYDMVDATEAEGPMAPPKMESVPLPSVINVATGEAAKMMEAGRPQTGDTMG
ncbi:hypothetical protein C0993_002107 [Termitomyces sp. T159_Od127]|nr:hypothetical protein C0993_002107 [Termitomyces sp. T159_Od127]